MQIIADTHIHAHCTLSSLPPPACHGGGFSVFPFQVWWKLPLFFWGVKMAVNPTRCLWMKMSEGEREIHAFERRCRTMPSAIATPSHR